MKSHNIRNVFRRQPRTTFKVEVWRGNPIEGAKKVYLETFTEWEPAFEAVESRLYRYGKYVHHFGYIIQTTWQGHPVQEVVYEAGSSVVIERVVYIRRRK